jgi:hypothetical protein
MQDLACIPPAAVLLVNKLVCISFAAPCRVHHDALVLPVTERQHKVSKSRETEWCTPRLQSK